MAKPIFLNMQHNLKTKNSLVIGHKSLVSSWRFKGQFLVEAMVAISIITVGLLGILALLSSATSLNRVVSDQYVATYLASESIEVVKSIVDANIINSRPWNQGLQNGTFEIQYDDTALRSVMGRPLKYQDGIYGYSQGNDTIFFRTLNLELVGSDKINVGSEVHWVTRGGVKFDVHISDVFTNKSTSQPMSAGVRTFGIQVTPAEDNNYPAAFNLVLSAGAKGGNLFLIWTDLEKSPGRYEPIQYASLGSPSGLPKDFLIHLTVAPINTTQKELPSDISSKPFDDPAVIERFEKLLDYIFTQIPDSQLTSFAIGNEVDTYLGSNAQAWNQYKRFYDVVYAYAKSKRPNLKVGVSATFAGLTKDAKVSLLQLNAKSDVIMTTYYPINQDLSVRDPNVVGSDMSAILALYPSKPLYLKEIGYPTSAVLNSSPEKQAQFVHEFFAVWDIYASRIPYVSFLNLHDWTKAQTDQFSQYYGFSNPRFGQFLGTLGLRTSAGSGSDKPGFKALLDEARARGWR